MYKRPESVLVVIHTAFAEVLLLQRADMQEYWQSVTGSLEENEQPHEAAAREVREETGLVAGTSLHDCATCNTFKISPAWKHRYAPGVSHNLEHVFTLCLPIRESIILNPEEHSASIWLPRDKALDIVSSPTNQAAIEQFVPAAGML